MGTLIRVVTGKKTDVFGAGQDVVVAAKTTRTMPGLSSALSLVARLVRYLAGSLNPCWRPATVASAQGVSNPRSSTLQRVGNRGRWHRPEPRLRSS